MPEPDDLMDQNLSKLLRSADGPPKMAPDRKAKMLDALTTELDKAVEDDRRRRTMGRSVRIVAWSMAAALAVVILAVHLFTSQPQHGDRRSWNGRGPVKHIEGDAAGPQFRLADGTLVYPRGTPNYKVVGERRLRLDKGQVLLFVAKSDKPFVVETPQATATAHGTTFTVSTRAGETFAAVAQGRVDLTNAAGSVRVRAGQQATAGKAGAPTRSAAPRFSYLVNWARQHLEGKELFESDESHSTGELVAVDPWGQQVRLQLRRYHIDVVVEDGIARTTIDQTFFNQLQWQIEGTFYFPLPPDASLSRLAMYVNGTLNEGGMVERHYGRQVYESIVYRRRDPALLEMMEGNVFKMRVFPLFGRREKRILLSYTQTLPQLYGTMRYWFPMEHTNDRAGELSIRVRFKNAAGRAKALSSTHGIKSELDGDDLLITYNAKDVPPNQDFLLHLLPRTEEQTTSITSFEQDGHNYLFARLAPVFGGTTEPQPRQWFVINDVSASRTIVDVKAQTYILERLLAEADDDDTFTVINLDTAAHVWKSELVGVREDRAGTAVAYADVPERMGATNLAAAFSTVGTLMKKTGAANAHVVYLGDGVATDGVTEIERLVSRLPEGAAFIGIGVGKTVDARLLQAAADASNGLFTTINPSEDVRWRVFDLVAALNTPRLVDIRTTFEDDDGKPVEVEAYPNTGTLAEGELLTVLLRTDKPLPARMTLTGRVGERTYRAEHDLAVARPKAAYLPRLWASARIDRLLRQGGAEHKKEIIALSKHYYVITPYTSLLVLETEADYKRWNVEMGRKDHWQLYPAPKKIKVVYEPLKHRPARQPVTAVKGKPGHPRTVEELVNSVLFRVYTPFYGYHPHQRRRMDRFQLQALLSGRLPMAGYGAVMPMMSRFEEGGAKSGGIYYALPVLSDPTALAEPDGPAPAILPRFGWGQRKGPSGYFTPRLGGDVDGDGLALWAYLGYGAKGGASDVLNINGALRGEFFKTSLGPVSGFSRVKLDPGIAAGESLPPVLLRDMDRDSLSRIIRTRVDRISLDVPVIGDIPWIGSLFRDGHMWQLQGQLQGQGQGRSQLAPINSLLREIPLTISADDELGLETTVIRDLKRAQMGRWREDRERIRSFNRRYGYWGHEWSAWDDDRRIAAGAALTFQLHTVLELAEEEEGRLRKRLPELLPELPARPATDPVLIQVAKKEALPPVLLRAYGRAMGAVPGTLAALASDRLVPLRSKIAALKPGPDRDKALKALDALLKRIPELSARTENTGIFWSHQGWSTTPQRWQFTPPQCQAWAGSRAMVDLTRYAPGLESTWADVYELVLARHGKKPRGTVEPDAAKLIADARHRVPVLHVQYMKDMTKEGGTALFEFWAGPQDRFAWTTTSPMYLREDVVCDGEAIYHVYPELGLAARRAGSVRRRAALRRMVPHLMPPAEELARLFNVALEKMDGTLTTVRLTPIPPETPPKEKPKALVVHVTFDARGALRKQVWSLDGKPRLTCDYAYDGPRVKGTWSADGKDVVEFAYRAEPIEPRVSPFRPKLDDTVVFDMPLHRPAYYAARLKEIAKDPAKAGQRNSLRRHLALAYLQDHSWQSPWGQPGQVWNTLWPMLQEQAKAGRKRVALGDLALIGSAGYASSLVNRKELDSRRDELPLVRYWLHQHNTNELKKLATGNAGIVGHLAAYLLCQRGGGEGFARAKQFFSDYPRSPLLYAAATYVPSESVWLALAKQPRWRFVALLAAANYVWSEKIAAAFEGLHKELTEKGWEVPLSDRLVSLLRQKPDRWQRIMKRWFVAAMKGKDVGALLRFAEYARPYGEPELADVAIDRAHDLADSKLPLTWKLTIAQSLWSMGRADQAWKVYEQIFAKLKADGIEPSPALLAAAARLAQNAGKPAQAVDLELRAIKAEEPYMPRQINVHLFRQRYQWLWGQLQARVTQCAAAVKAKPDDAKAKQALDEALARAREVWLTWRKVDAQNSANLHRQLATLHHSAGDKAQAWRVLSTLIDEKPKEGQSYYNVGAWYVGLGQRDAGQKWYARAYEVEPTNGDWIWRRAELLRTMGRKDEAKALYEEIVNKTWQPRFEHLKRYAQKKLKEL